MIRRTLVAALCATTALLAPLAAQADTAAAETAAPQAAATDPAVLALAPVPQGKLGEAVRPLAYRIDTRFDPSLAGFGGRTEIDVELAAPTDHIDLHGRDLAIASVAARTASGTLVAGTWHPLDASGVARIVFAAPLPAGKATLEFSYTGHYQDAPSGLFHTQIDGKWYGWSQFESIDARAAFPGFDDPGFKVPMTVTIRTRPGEVAVSNAPEVSSTLEDGWQVHRFAPTLPLPTYLVAMMSGPFAVKASAVPPTPQRAEPLPLRIVTTQNNAAQMDYALEQTKPIVALLEDYFGQAFPYPKLDQISSPLMGGAMENAGADLYADTILMLAPDASIAQRKLFGMVVAHELAHQWFGDLVTPRWWDDIWLNESFANWMGYTIGGAWQPSYGIGDGALEEGFVAMGTDALAAGRPIHQPIASNDAIDSAFDTITYGKGGHVVSMIAAFMGPERFRDGVRRYMAAHRYGTATSKDFFAAMAEAAGDPRITAAMQSFTDQQGVPLITVTGGAGRYTISQSRYAPLGVTAPATRWGVPVCVRLGEARKCQLLTDQSAAFEIAGEGVLMPNAGGTGYYRFDVPAAEWDRLIAAADTLPGPEAMALAYSFDAAFAAGKGTPAQALALLRKLYANPDPAAADVAFLPFSRARRAGWLDEAGTAGYRRLIAATARPRLENDFSPAAGRYGAEDAGRQQIREGIVGDLILARDPATVATMAEAAAGLLAGNAAALDPTFYALGFAAYLQREGLAGARTLAAAALGSSDSRLRDEALTALAGSGDAAIAGYVLGGFGGDTRLRAVERSLTAMDVLTPPETRELGYAWLRANAKELVAGKGGIFLASRVPGAVAEFCSAERAAEIESLLVPLMKGTPGALALDRNLERIRNCAALRTARAAEMNAFLAGL